MGYPMMCKSQYREVAFEGTKEMKIAEEGGGLSLKRRHHFF